MSSVRKGGGRLAGLVGNVITSYGRFFVSIAIMAILTPYLVEKLGADAFGLWSLTLSILGFFSLLDLGFGTALVKYVAECRGAGDVLRRNRIVSTLMGVYLLLTIVSALAVAALAHSYVALMQIPQSSASLSLLLLWLLALRTVFVPLPLSVFRSILQGQQCFTAINAIQTITVMLYGVGSWIALEKGGGLLALAMVQIITTLLEYGAYIWATYKQVPDLCISVALFETGLLKEVGEYSMAAFVVNVASLILLKTDPIIIKLFLPLSAVAMYAVVLKIAEALLMLLKQFINVLSPLFAELKGEGQNEKIRFVFLNCTRLAMVPGLGAGLFLMFYGRELLVFWIGPEFAQGGLTLQILTLSVLFSLPQMLASAVLSMTGEHRVTAKAAIWSAVINVILSLALIGRFGINGVAAATLSATIIVDIFIVLRVACQAYQVSVVEYGKRVILPLLLPSLAQLLVLVLGRYLKIESLLALLLLGASSAVVFGLAFLRFGLDNQELAYLKSKLRRR